MFSKFTQEETDNIDRHISFQETEIVVKILIKKNSMSRCFTGKFYQTLKGKKLVLILQNCFKNLKRILFDSSYEAIQKLGIKERKRNRGSYKLNIDVKCTYKQGKF